MVVKEKCGVIGVFFVKSGENEMIATLQFDILGQAFEKHAHL